VDKMWITYDCRKDMSQRHVAKTCRKNNVYIVAEYVAVYGL
jgi:hypothetical protein